jgi:hemolysin III
MPAMGRVARSGCGGWEEPWAAEFRRRARACGYTLAESIANIITHALGLILALIGAPLLVMLADRVGRAEHVAACAVYGVSLVVLFATSTSYHCRQGRPGDRLWLILDHICILLLIAGTTTAMAVVAIRGDDRWYLLGTVWALTAAAIIVKLAYGLRFERFAPWFYAALGLGAAMTIPAMVRRLPGDALAFIVGGAAAYLLGLFYYLRVGCGRIPFSHAVWHLMVLTGSGMFYFAVRECLLAAASAR